MKLPWTKKAPAEVMAKASGELEAAARELARLVGGQRARLTSDNPQAGIFAGVQLLSPPDAENRWRDLRLDSRTLDRMSPDDLLELLCDLSPDVSRALWDFLRLMNPGWELECFRVGSSDVRDARAEATLVAFIETLNRLYGDFDVTIGRLNIMAWLRGAYFAELVLDDAGRVAVDLATPDPRHVRFRSRQDPVRGKVWEPFQWQNGRQISLDVETVRYVPVDPLPGKPYGRGLAPPALFVTLFTLGLLHDLRRVVAHQGYPRLDITIVTEHLQKWMPANIRDDAAAMRSWLASVIEQVKTAYSQLEPDDAYVHTDAQELGRPVGTVDSDSLGAVDGLVAALERMAMRALKSVPFAFGLAQSTTETQANRQYELMAAGIRALQHLAEGLLEYMFGLALRAAGQQATVRFRFAEFRASERVRDAQADALEIQNALARYFAGWVSHEQAAKEGAGVDAPAAAAPLLTPSGWSAGTGEASLMENPEPGTARGRRGTRGIEVEGKPLASVPEEVEITEADEEAAEAVFDATMPEFKGILSAAVIGNGKDG